MNTGLDSTNIADFEQNLDNNFNTATKLSSAAYDYSTLLQMLQSDEIIKIQIAALELKEVKSKEDAFILTSNLVGQDGKVREAVAFKINELFKNKEYRDFFLDEKVFDIFFQGIMDINGNICRQIIDLSTNNDFGNFLCTRLPERIKELINEIENLDKMSKQYVVSKRNFQLYWCLEALNNVIDIISFEEIKDILFITGEFQDYTIREKTAKILSKLNNNMLPELRNTLKNDENYYVRRYL